MKKLLLLVGFITQLNFSQNIEYKIVTTVESIIPNVVGRSRMITTDVTQDTSSFTSDRGESEKNKSKRKDVRVKDFEETKLLNFFNIGGIRFENIVANDVMVSSKMNEMANQGWELAFVTSGVESDAGEGDGKGLFISHYIFKRTKL